MNMMRPSTIWSSKVSSTLSSWAIVLHDMQGCALRPDLALMPDGDLTEVGEKGLFQSSLHDSILKLDNLGITVSYLNVCRYSINLLFES